MLHLGKRAYFGIIILFLSLLAPSWAEARFINLSGSLDLNYGSFKTEQNNETDETTFFQQRYNLRNFGELFDPRIGTILMSATYLEQDTKTDGQGDQDFEFTDYSIALNLFPTLSPLSLYYQRVTRSNRFESPLDMKDKDLLTTFGGNWALSASFLPRISLSYNQSEAKSIDDPNRLPSTLNRFVNLESSGRVGETSLIGRYQFNETDVARTALPGQQSGSIDTIKGNSFNLTTESRLAPALVLSTYSRLTTDGGSSERNGTGSAFTQEQGIGASLFYTPSVHWDTHARIDYAETPSTRVADPNNPGRKVDLVRQSAFLSGSYRPMETLDMVMSGRYSSFDISDSKTTSPYFDYSLNYRPFFGLSSGLGAAYGWTETEASQIGAVNIDTSYQRYRGYLNYTRALEVLRYSASYALAYGMTDTDQSDAIGNTAKSDETDLMNTITLRVENTRIRLIHLALSYTLNDIDRDLNVPQATNSLQPVPANQEIGDQLSHRVQLNADSSYFRGLLLEDDSLILQSTASWTKIEGFGPDGDNFLTDARGTYYFLRGGMLSSGWTYQDYPGGFYLDSHIFYEEIRWTFYLGNTTINFGARANQERTQGDSSFDRDIIETTSAIVYRIGKFVLSLDGRWSEDTSKSLGDNVEYKSQSIFGRMSRSF